MILGLIPAAFLILLFFLASVKTVREYERAVVFRLGRVMAAKGPGLLILVPGLDRMARVSLRLVTLDVPPQDVVTRDNVSAHVEAVVFFRVTDPVRAVIEVADYLSAVSRLASTSLRGVCGEVVLDELLAGREVLNEKIQEALDLRAGLWGIKVTAVEISRIELPPEMKKALAREAQAERERRGRVIAADAEYEAAGRLAEAAAIIRREPGALALRYIEAIGEMGSERATTTIFPLPVEIFGPLLESYAGGRKRGPGTEGEGA